MQAGYSDKLCDVGVDVIAGMDACLCQPQSLLCKQQLREWLMMSTCQCWLLNIISCHAAAHSGPKGLGAGPAEA